MLTERFGERFFKSDEAKAKEGDEILALLKNSPDLEERRRERDEKRLAQIKDLLAQREQIQQTQRETMPRLQAAVAEAREKEKQAHEALQAATRESINTEQARLGASLDFRFRLEKIEAEIKKTAPQEIEDFIWEMLKADEKARLELKHEERPGTQGLDNRPS